MKVTNCIYRMKNTAGMNAIGRLCRLILGVLLLSSCSNLRYLEDGQRLYTGSNIRIEAEEALPEKPEKELESVVRPVPNQKFLFWRPRLWLYNVAGEPSGKGLRHIMRNRLGRPPVLFEEEDVLRSVRLMENRLINLGYFDGEVSAQVRKKEKTAVVDYQVRLRPPYVIRMVHPITDDSELAVQINGMLDQSLLLPGMQYRLDVLKKERERIDRRLKSLGYYYFHPDYLIFLADTSQGGREVDLHLRIKGDIPSQALTAYEMGNIFLVPDYLAELPAADLPADTIRVREGIYMVDRLGHFRPELFASNIMFEKGRLYDIESHDQSLGKLMGLGVFRFVNLRFSPSGQSQEESLDLRILLSPMKRKSLSAEIRGVSKSTNFAGPGFTASFSNNNLFGGAEMLRLTIGGTFETLISRRLDPVNAWEAGLETELIFPGFVAPVFRPSISSRFVPRTRFSFSWDYFNRTDAFSLNSLKFQYGYNWNQSHTVRHSLSPALINLFIMGRVREGFEDLISAGLIQRRGLFEQFIMGSQYSFFYNSQQKPGEQRVQDIYFNMNLDVSGNLAYLIADKVVNASRSADGDYQVFGQGFSQYSRADIDLRYYRRLGDGHRLAARLIAGAGLPYGNSEHLPYVKLFTIGGVNSIRAFHPRTLGPGAYNPPDSLAGRFNPYQTGELKLEVNLEYRFNITGMLKGAVFADAGNIWRLEADENTPGGEFRRDMFLKQLALGAGAGIRIDVTFFVLRLDFAFPLAIPYNDRFPEPVQPLKRQWRRDNLVFNLAIGYPF
jgi:outer membrane protein insertion porin family